MLKSRTSCPIAGAVSETFARCLHHQNDSIKLPLRSHIFSPSPGRCSLFPKRSGRSPNYSMQVQVERKMVKYETARTTCHSHVYPPTNRKPHLYVWHCGTYRTCSGLRGVHIIHLIWTELTWTRSAIQYSSAELSWIISDEWCEMWTRLVYCGCVTCLRLVCLCGQQASDINWHAAHSSSPTFILLYLFAWLRPKINKIQR